MYMLDIAHIRGLLNYCTLLQSISEIVVLLCYRLWFIFGSVFVSALLERYNYTFLYRNIVNLSVSIIFALYILLALILEIHNIDHTVTSSRLPCISQSPHLNIIQ